MHYNYNEEQKSIQNVIYWYIIINDPNTLALSFSKKKFKTSSLIITNNSASQNPIMCISYANYYPNNRLTLNYYIGHTEATLSCRLKCHLKRFSAIRSQFDQHIPNK